MDRNKNILKNLFFLPVILILLLTNKDSFGFKTISQAEKYAGSIEEFPKPDSDDLVNPTYKDFYGMQTLKNVMGMLPKWMSSFAKNYILPKKLWYPDDFLDALHKATFQRELEGLKPNYIVKFTATPEDRFYIFGPIAGSFHSLVRDLKELKKLKVLDESLNIIDKNSKIIFNGNVVNGAPYVAETLNLILDLLNKNPQNVFYNLGRDEYEDDWMNSDLNDEVRTIRSTVHPEFDIIRNAISRFFKTLSLGIFINNSHEENNFIRVSYFGRSMEKLSEENYPDLLKKKVAPGEYKIIKYSEKEKLSDKVKIAAIIKSDERLNKVNASNGMYIMESEGGATSWAVLSSPNLSYKKLYQFNYDAFAILSVKNVISESVITLVHQDVRITKGFDQDHNFNILSGQEFKETTSTEIKLKPSIILGSTLALSKSIATMGSAVKAGLSLKENLINKLGGINGQQIEIIFEDDAYTPDIALHNVKKFIEEYHTSTIITPIGTPTLEACLDMIKKHEILALFPITGASIFRDKNLKNIINYRASYTQEVRAMIKYITSQSSAKRFAFFYQNDAYGLGPLEAAKITLSKMGLTDWVDIPYTRNEFNIESAVAKIKETKPDAIALFSTGVATSELIRRLGSENLTTKVLFTISFAADNAFKSFARSKGVNIIFAHVVPNPEESDIPLVKEYREGIKKTGALTSTFSLESYIAMSIFAHAAEKISKSNNKITKENMITALESIKDLDLDGIKLNFDPESRELSQTVWLDTGASEWLKFDKSDLRDLAETATPQITPTKQDLTATNTATRDLVKTATKNVAKQDLVKTGTLTNLKQTTTIITATAAQVKDQINTGTLKQIKQADLKTTKT